MTKETLITAPILPPPFMSTNSAHKISRRITADLANKQLDELFIDANASIDIQIAVTEYQSVSAEVYFANLSAHLQPGYLRIITESLQAQNSSALTADSHYLKLNSSHQKMLAALKQQASYQQHSDAQLIEIALLQLLRK